MAGVLLVFALSCARPLAPGETRCSTTPVFGTMVTNCKSGPPLPQTVNVVAPSQPAPPPGWWCTVRSEDGFGACFYQPGECEVYRSKGGENFQPCAYFQRAICAPTGCYLTPNACAQVERGAGRDGSACTVR